MFTLAFPWVFCLLPLPWLIWRFFPKVRPHATQAMLIPFFDMVTSINHQTNTRLSIFSADWNIWYGIWILLLFALASPMYIGPLQPIERQGHQIMMVLDLSPSMQVKDMQQDHKMVSRLSVVKQAARQFVEKRSHDKIGLILFGTRAYLQTPLTYDKQNILMRLNDATVGLAGNTTSIGDALGLAVLRLKNTQDKGRIVILLTDGANNSGVLTPSQAAALAKTNHIKVYTIGLSSDLNPDSFGAMFLRMHAALDLDEGSLKAIAADTGGQYFRATDMDSLNTIYHTIHQLEAIKDHSVWSRPKTLYYMYPLACALLLTFAWVWWRLMK